MAPGICSCPEGWLGGACHTGELRPSTFICIIALYKHDFICVSSSSPAYSNSVQFFFLLVHSLDAHKLCLTEISVCQMAEYDINRMYASAKGKFSAQCFSRCDKTQTRKHFCSGLHGQLLVSQVFTND